MLDKKQQQPVIGKYFDRKTCLRELYQVFVSCDYSSDFNHF